MNDKKKSIKIVCIACLLLLVLLLAACGTDEKAEVPDAGKTAVQATAVATPEATPEATPVVGTPEIVVSQMPTATPISTEGWLAPEDTFPSEPSDPSEPTATAVTEVPAGTPTPEATPDATAATTAEATAEATEDNGPVVTGGAIILPDDIF